MMDRIQDFIKRLPKAELHLHLEGTILPPTLVELSARHDATPMTLREAKAHYRFDDFSSFIHKPYIKLNLFNIMDRQALTNANNISAFLAANPSYKITDVNGVGLYPSEPYYSLLEGRTFFLTFGASF